MKKFFSIAIFLSLILVSSCAYKAAKSPMYIGLENNYLYVKHGWSGANISSGELSADTVWKRFPLSGLNNVRPLSGSGPLSPHDLGLGQRGLYSEWTYCIPFTLDDAKWKLIEKDSAFTPGLYIEDLGDNWEIYLNGNQIESYLYLNDKGEIIQHGGYYTSNMFPVFNQFFKEGENILAVRIIGDADSVLTGMDNTVYFEDYFFLQNRFNELLKILIIGFLLTIGLFYIIVYLARMQDIQNLYFGLMSVFSSISIGMTLSSVRFLIPDSNIHMRLDNIAVVLFMFFLGCFFDQINWGKIKLFTKVYACYCLACILGAIIVPFPAVENVLWAANYSVIPYALYTLFYNLIYAFNKLRKEMGFSKAFKTTALGNMIFPTMIQFFGYLADSAKPVYLFYGTVRLRFVSLAIFLGAGAVILIRNYVSALVEKDKLNASLEDTVKKRTQDLETQTLIALEQSEIALEASHAKSDFLARMSHDIRTPLNAILGIIKLQLRRNPPDTFYEDAITIQNEGNSLLHIVNDILDFSKIESGKLQLINEEYELATLLNNTGDIIRNRADEKSLAFNIRADSTLPAKLRGDSNKIMQILLNILGNAVKYTEKGHVFMQVSGKMTGNDSSVAPQIMLQFKVEDTGIGIKAEDMNNLFKDFTRLDIEKNKNVAGTGLGLVIASSFAQAMGGSIGVESVYGKGTSFTIKLIQTVTDESPIGSVVIGRGGRRAENYDELADTHLSAPDAFVLVVDDVETNIKVAKGMIEVFDIHTDTASSANEAIQKVQQKSYDLVFMDQMMPEKDGIEATEEIRAMGFTHIPIIALTANAIEGTKDLLLSKGFNDYISKPIDFARLNAVLTKWLPKDKLKEKTDSEEDKEKTEPGLAQILDNIPGLNVSLALSRIGGMEVFYINTLSALFEKKAENKAKLEESLANKDLKAFSLVAHSIKGQLAFIGAEDMAKAASELNLHARKGDAAWCAKELQPFMDKLDALLQIIYEKYPASFNMQ
ncbi:MAG: response regulator [Spirochaetaceae bacterium]|nr:response regulator [Spirochaetaceae bacterium]